jgi:hypothetical protein
MNHMIMVIKCTKLYDPEACDWFGSYFAYQASILYDATTLTSNRLHRLLFFSIIVTKHTKVCDPGAYSSVYILPTRFLY